MPNHRASQALMRSLQQARNRNVVRLQAAEATPTDDSSRPQESAPPPSRRILRLPQYHQSS